MLKVVSSIDPDERHTERLLSRSPEAALAELRQCITRMNEILHALAVQFPGVVAVGGIMGCGKAAEVLAFAPSVEGDHFSPVAMDRAMTLAKIVAALPEELAAVFEIEVRTAREINRLRGEMERAVSAALAASGIRCGAAMFNREGV